MAEPKEPKKTGKKKAKKARAEAVYVPVAYPLWFGAASFAWAVVGWLIAAFARKPPTRWSSSASSLRSS